MMSLSLRVTLRMALLAAALGTARCIDEHIATHKLRDAASSPEQYQLRGSAAKRANEDGADDWGGWAPGNAATSAFDSQICNFDVRTDPVSVDEFIDKYVKAERPVLLRGAAADGVHRGWRAMTHWGEREFLAKYGDKWRLNEDEETRRTVRAWHTAEPDLYHWATLDTDKLTKEAQTDFEVPPLFGGAMHKNDFLAASVFLSPPGEGAGFHFHNDAMSILVHGRKRWFVYAPDVSSQVLIPEPGSKDLPGQIPQKYFYEQVYPKVVDSKTQRPFECVQRPGEVLYVPHMWSHSTFSIGATISLSFLRNSPWGLRMSHSGDARPRAGPVRHTGHVHGPQTKKKKLHDETR